MRRTWRLDSFHDGIWLIDMRPDHGGEDFRPRGEILWAAAASLLVDTWFPAGPGEEGSDALLADVVAAIGDPSVLGPSHPPSALREIVREALHDGRLRALRASTVGLSGMRPSADADVDPNDAPPHADQGQPAHLRG